MRRAFVIAWLLGAACVPADEAVGSGSVQFTFTASTSTVNGLKKTEVADQYTLTFGRVVLGFRTMTVGRIGAPDTCSYRGRGALADAVFDPRVGLVQTFNGIGPVDCPDVGAIFGAPENTTLVAPGTSSDDLVALAQGGLHALVDVTATPPPDRIFGRPIEPYTIALRFNPSTTSTRFGGCNDPNRKGGHPKGVQIHVGTRDSVTVQFAAESFFRESIGTGGALRVAPFAQADAQGNNDHIVTMDELDDLQLTSIRSEGFYQLPTDALPVGTASAGSFGDFVRFLFRFSLYYRSDAGSCIGNPPGSG